MSIPLMTCMDTSSLSVFYKYIPSYPSPCIIHPTLNLTPNIPMHFATSITHPSIYPPCTPSYFFDACTTTIETSFSNTHQSIFPLPVPLILYPFSKLTNHTHHSYPPVFHLSCSLPFTPKLTTSSSLTFHAHHHFFNAL